MRKSLISSVAAACWLVSFGAQAQSSPPPYRFDLSWSGVGYYCYYKSLCDEVLVSGAIPITTAGEAGTYHQSLGGYDFTLVTTPDGGYPLHFDAEITGTIRVGSAGSGGSSNTFEFYATSANPASGQMSSQSGELLGFFGTAQITQGTAIPEPAVAALLLAGLPVLGALGRRRKS